MPKPRFPLFAVFLLSLAACVKETPITIINGGDIVSAREITTSWNDSIRSQIETTKGVFTVNGVASVFKGMPTIIETYPSGRRRLCAKDRSFCYWLY